MSRNLESLLIEILTATIFIISILIMINCVMRALSSGLSEGWSRCLAHSRIAGTLPKMQLLQCVLAIIIINNSII